ncbi:hypothetical protein [Halorarius litoreus]|uniref:hypothetical protein n=1 Tax=Halorarius litoreus TaxID=2962676 RepID=UPI0020CF4391|nr:hypothetical protein [Halorarius litoreus]
MKPSIALSEIGELAGLTVVGWLVALVVGVGSLLAVSVLLPDSSTAVLVVAFLLPLLGLYLLFGTWDWSPGGEARQHATFLVCQFSLLALVGGVGYGLLSPDGVGRWLVLLAGLFATPVAGWLAYFDGIGRVQRALAGGASP